MKDKGYTVEYVPPMDNLTILQEFFGQIQEKLAANFPGDIAGPPTQNVTKSNDTYYYKILLKNDIGEILFRYDDYMSDFHSFEEYMHSNSSDWGRLDIEIKIKCSLLENSLFKYEIRTIEKNEIQDVSYQKGENYGEIVASRAGGIYLLNPNEDEINSIYNGIIDLWNQIKRVMTASSRLMGN